MKTWMKNAGSALTLGTALSCASQSTNVKTVAMVDLPRFMGSWRVQGHTPLFIDNNSSNQIETYTLNEDGTIATEYQFDRWGRTNTLHPKGRVFNTQTKAHWKMQFLWPFESDYLIVRIANDYSFTVVSGSDKESIWIMSRELKMPEDQYQAILADLKKEDYPIEKIRRVPQEK